MLTSSVIREISLDLNDQEQGHEYVRWTAEQLQTYVREALGTVSDILRDLFVKQKVVRVERGWQRACDCTSILRVLGESDAQGNILRRLWKQIDDADNVWGGAEPRCSTAMLGYDMQSYVVSSTDPKGFQILPPLPPRTEKYVLLECYERPSGEMSYDMPDEVVAMVKQWALYRALAVDSENNPTITQLAQMHFSTYQALLKEAQDRREREKLDERRGVRAVQNRSSSTAQG